MSQEPGEESQDVQPEVYVHTKDIPERVRAEVIERDGHVCRCCGIYQEHPHLHHIVYRSQLGRHVAGNLISLCYRCHMDRGHGPDNRAWRDLFELVVLMPGVNAVQLRRWQMQTL